MGLSCMIVADPGSGKSTSIENLNPETTFIINVSGKSLPFKGWRKKYVLFTKEKGGNYFETSKPSIILKLLEYIDKEMKHINTVVIDDFQFISAFEFMDRIEEKGFEKFNSIGKNMYLVSTKPKELRDNLLIVYLTHAETSSDIDGLKRTKAKTIGKLVDEKISLEGLFTVVLYGRVKKTKDGIKYVFETVNNGENTCKSPRGMFEDSEIPNDLELVRQKIFDYND